MRLDIKKNLKHKIPVNKYTIIILTGLLVLASCDIFEDPPTSSPLANSVPETYLSVSSQSMIFVQLDTVICDTLGNCDSMYAYYFEADSIPPGEMDTLDNALQTILASTQTMTWWGEDPDGDIIGYYYKWMHEDDWTFTTSESETFIIPIRTAFGIFGFSVKAMDSDSLVDSSPAEITLPIRNTPPVVDFRYQSNPVVTGSTPDITERTFPTRTFLWTVADDDGLETVDSIFYALDDTSQWIGLPASEKGITLSDLEPGTHVFYVKARDIAGAESVVIHYPDLDDDSTPNTWEVMEPVGDVLLVDDYDFDPSNNALTWYEDVLDTITAISDDGYSIWEIGRNLPYSETDVSATLGYFKHIVWYTAVTGPETYGDASNAIYQFIQQGGNVLVIVTELTPSAAIWHPFDSTAIINPDGRLFSGTDLHSLIDSTLDLRLSKLIPYRVSSIALTDTSEIDPVNGPYYTPLYRLPEPGPSDPWIGRPLVAAEYDHTSPINENAGKAILFTIPMHDGTAWGGATMEGNGSGGKFISWVLQERFLQ